MKKLSCSLFGKKYWRMLMPRIFKLHSVLLITFSLCLGSVAVYAAPNSSNRAAAFDSAACLKSCAARAATCKTSKKSSVRSKCKAYLSKCSGGCAAKKKVACFKSCENDLRVCKNKSSSKSQLLEKCTRRGAGCLSKCSKER